MGEGFPLRFGRRRSQTLLETLAPRSIYGLDEKRLFRPTRS